MKNLFIVLLLALLGAGALLHVVYRRQVEGRIEALQKEMRGARAELQSRGVSLGVYRAEHAKKAERLAQMEEENQRLRKRLGLLLPGEPEGLAEGALRAKLLGLTPRQLKEDLGDPVSVLGPESEWWYYKGNVAYDPATHEPFKSVQILFVTGHVARVTFAR